MLLSEVQGTARASKHKPVHSYLIHGKGARNVVYQSLRKVLALEAVYAEIPDQGDTEVEK